MKAKGTAGARGRLAFAGRVVLAAALGSGIAPALAYGAIAGILGIG